MFSLKQSLVLLTFLSVASAFPTSLFPRLFPQSSSQAAQAAQASLPAQAKAQTFSIPFEQAPLFQAAAGGEALEMQAAFPRQQQQQPAANLIAHLVEPNESGTVDKIEHHIDQQIEQSLYAGQPAEQAAVSAKKDHNEQEEANGEELEPQVVDKRDDKEHHEHQHHEHQHHEHQHHEHQHEHPPEAFEVHHKKGGKSFQYFHQGHQH